MWQDGKHPPPRGCRVQVFPKLLLGPSHRDNVSSGSLQTAGENPGKLCKCSAILRTDGAFVNALGLDDRSCEDLLFVC